MGLATTTEYANAAAVGDLKLEAALHAHLTSNHYPPVHPDFVMVAADAIRHAEEGDWLTSILMPNGVTLTVAAIVEGLHLQPFVNLLEGED